MALKGSLRASGKVDLFTALALNDTDTATRLLKAKPDIVGPGDADAIGWAEFFGRKEVLDILRRPSGAA